MLLTSLLSLAAATSQSCPIENAHYALRADRTVTAEFHPTARSRDWPLGLTFGIHISKTGRTYWWLPWNGGTDDLQNIRLTGIRGRDHPTGHGDLEFWTTDADYNFLNAVPKAGDAAPAHIFIPSLGRALWMYTVQTAQADSVPRAFFDLVSCGKANAPVDVVLLPVA